jgi:ribosomal protein S27E
MMEMEWVFDCICYYCGNETVYVSANGAMFCSTCGEFLGYNN